MKIFLGADHRGFHLREGLITYLTQAGYEVVDDGDQQYNQDDDFPVYVVKVANDLLASDDPEARGIILCGSGQGVCMAANRFKGIRAALGYNMETIRGARNDDDANVLCLPADDLAEDKHKVNLLVETFLNTPFAGAPRFIRRLKELDDLI